jgi:hypothetical protein
MRETAAICASAVAVGLLAERELMSQPEGKER